jgi:hypothetical protein
MAYANIVAGSIFMVFASVVTLLVWRFVFGAIEWRLHRVIVATAAFRGESAESCLLAGGLLIIIGIVLARLARA